MVVYDDQNPKDPNAPKTAFGHNDLANKESAGQSSDLTGSDEKNGLFKGKEGKSGAGKEMFNVTDNFLPPQARFGKFLGQKLTKKNSVIGGIVATITAVAIFAFTILQGPLQLVHLSQILRLNMSKNEGDANIRMRGIYASARTGRPGYTRVGTLGQWRVNKTITKLQKMGIEIRTTSLMGNPTVVEFDISNPDSPYHGMGKEEAIKSISKDLGADPVKVGQTSGHNGIKISANVRDVGEKALRGNNRVLTAMTGDSKIINALDARALNKFLNVTMHPLNRLENKAARKNEVRAREKREAERQKKLRAPSRGKVTGLREKLGDKVGARGIKAGMFALAGTEAICVVHDISGIVPEYNKAIRDDSVAAAYDLISVGEQIRAGEDFDIDQLGGVVQNFQDKDGKSIWASKPLQATSGVENPSGVDMDKNMKQAYTGDSSWNDIHAFTGNIPGIDVVCSTGGQIAIGTIGILSLALGPGGVALNASKAVVGGVAGVAVMNLATKLITPDIEPPELIQGPPGGSFVAYGAREAANATALSHGGAELSSSESAAIDNQIAQENRAGFRQKSFFARMFDIYDYRSLASTSIQNINISPHGVLSFLGNSLNPGNSISKLSSAITPKSSATNNYDWGFNRAGMKESTLTDAKYADSVDNAEKAINAIKANGGLADRAKACFGVELNAEQTGFTPIGVPDQYGEDYQNANCSDNSEVWTRVSLAVFDDRIVVAAACYEGDDDSCQAISGTQSAAPEETGDTADDADFEIKKLGSSMHTPGGKVSPVKGITLHWWGSQYGSGIRPLVSALSSNPSCGSGGCSVQLGITSDGEVYQLTKNLNDLTYHAIGANKTTIGIEIEGGPGEFGKKGIERYPEKFEAVVKTVKYLMKKYDIEVEGSVNCGDVSGIHAHLEYNKCPGAGGKDDIDDYYFKEVMKRVKE
ncbi:hypothetical protein A3F37_03470 [Candidatus Saccharibacteria bacterium RIFCSPHIGHO2_12_FULL_41_12]|nr:MAG: hypothetical protein A3F37_03470 [Candidatus Saccharibacteria bacterium RIFCSPHIGHO2_12_FULL_41_12]